MDYHAKIITDIETHDVEGIVECFENGVNPNELYNGQPLIYELTSGYGRSPRFKECVRAFVDHGLNFPDPLLLSVLLDDAHALNNHLLDDPLAVNRQYSLRCAYTPLKGATLLHICAEFNHMNCARMLIRHGADINAVAAIDEMGFGGHTPVFHTVNQNSNNSIDMLMLLLEQRVDLSRTVRGFVWGAGYPWETFIPSVNPISYAMMGLLPQMHRDPKVIANNIALLLRKAYDIDYTPPNVPNKYLS